MFQNSAAQVKALVSMRQDVVLSMLQNDPAGNNQYLRRTISILTRHIRLFGKFFRRMQQLSHERFVLLPMSGDLIMFYWTQVMESTNYPENFVAGTSAALHVALLGIMMVSDIASVIRLRHGRVPCQIVGSRHNFIQGKSFAVDATKTKWDAQQE